MAKVMHDMELNDETAFEMALPAGIAEKPRYPWGLRISLEDEQLKALGLDCADCNVGGIVHLHALGKITSVTQNDTSEGAKARVEIQITSMCCIESEDEENREAEAEMGGEPLSSRRKKLYDRATD